jgi:transcriptional regulator with XRE-family HTH domain
MSAPSSEEAQGQGLALSVILKALRRRRGLRPAEVALRMGMPLRSYEHFEAGRGRLNLDRIQLFARVTDTDPHAILAALALDAPGFAAACADNKLMTILMMAVEDFHGAAGAEIARLEPSMLIAAFTRAFEELADQARSREAAVEAWLSRRRAGPPLEETPEG